MGTFVALNVLKNNNRAEHIRQVADNAEHDDVKQEAKSWLKMFNTGTPNELDANPLWERDNYAG